MHDTRQFTVTDSIYAVENQYKEEKEFIHRLMLTRLYKKMHKEKVIAVGELCVSKEYDLGIKSETMRLTYEIMCERYA